MRVSRSKQHWLFGAPLAMTFEPDSCQEADVFAANPARRTPAVPLSKLCPACHQWKSSADFLRISKNADGLAHKCKPCAMKSVDGPTLAEKACSKCKEVKPKSQFCINKYMQDGMQVRVIILMTALAGLTGVLVAG